MFGFGAPTFSPDKDIPDLSGKVILVTGGNSGLGEETILQLSKHHPAKIFLASRNEENGEKAIARIQAVVPDAKLEFLSLDLTSLKSVAEAAKTVDKATDRLDLLINNAGIMACPAGTTQEGYEIQFGTNHMGHALLTKLLLPKLEKTTKLPGADVRIVTLSSIGHQWSPKGGLVLDECHSDMKSTASFTRYGQSKLANILFSDELARRYPEILSVAVHPGSVNTGLKRGIETSYPWLKYPMSLVIPFMSVSVQQGALNQLWAATSKDAKSGRYYVPVAKESNGSAYAHDTELAGKLWKWTEDELNKFLAANPV